MLWPKAKNPSEKIVEKWTLETVSGTWSRPLEPSTAL